MVVLDYPDNTCQRFVSWNYFALGPLDANAEYRAVQIELPFRSARFEPSRGIYDENNIVHSAHHGRVFYYPILADCTPVSDSQHPRAIRVPVKGYFYPDVVFPRGFACPNTGVRADVFSGMGQMHWAISRDYANKSWTIFAIGTWIWNPPSCTVNRWDITFHSWTSPTQAMFTIRSTQDAQWPPPTCPFDPSQEASYEQIVAVANSVKTWSSPSTVVTPLDVFLTDPSVALTPSKLSENLEIFVDDLMNREFPIPEVDYGELAARAVKQKRLVDTNLWEFLSDLKNFKSLAPKLKNLKSLKTWSGNYLAIKYGVLPTVSDLQKIVGAFKARKPFFDKFGNTVYNASNTGEVCSSGYSCTLAQYIKVPVANEDSTFAQLMDRLEEYGFALTLENVWDLTKYSFVIDWFVDVGGFLERIDDCLRLSRYNIPYVTMSRKKAFFGELPQQSSLPILGPIGWSFYHRWVTSQCPLPPLTLSTTPTVSNHWLEAAALIIQRAH